MKMKKRFLGVLFGLVMILGLMIGMSTTAYALPPESGASGSLLGDPYANLKNTITEITFDGKPWYLIDYDSSTVTLLSKECVAASKYNSSVSFVHQVREF